MGFTKAGKRRAMSHTAVEGDREGDEVSLGKSDVRGDSCRQPRWAKRGLVGKLQKN
jgi:hypothetical protein